jgi:NAD(P)H-dependent FMN reductase
MPVSDQSKLKILVIVGSVRQNRVGRKIADWYLQEAIKAAPDLDFELFDLADHKLPIFSEPVSPSRHEYNELQNQLAAKVGTADGFIFVTAEYNHTIPGGLKNFLDYLYAEWNRKAAAFVGYGGMGGARAIEHLKQVMTELQVASTRNDIGITSVWDALDEKGVPKPEFVHGNIAKHLQELTWWVKALKTAREQS